MASPQEAAQRPVNAAWATFSGLSASLVGLGLARLAYTPLIPALIAAGWFSPSQAIYLGAANLAGYLAGAVLARTLAAWLPTSWLLRAMMVLTAATFFASATPVSFAWFFAWRFAAGFAGAVLIVLAATEVLPHVPPARRAMASGAIFAGIGLGVIASGTLVPLLLRAGLATTWIGLGILTLVLTAASWPGWPPPSAPVPAAPVVSGAPPPRGRRMLRALYVEYGLNAVGLVPHMVFLVDFIARGLGQGVAAGAWYWTLFGVGATVVPAIVGALADRTGIRFALRLMFALEVIAAALLCLPMPPAWALAVSSVVMGAAIPGVVSLVLGRSNELVQRNVAAGRKAWGVATTAFAVGQAVGAYGLSFLFAQNGGDYRILFAIGAVAFALALTIDFAAGRGGASALDQSGKS